MDRRAEALRAADCVEERLLAHVCRAGRSVDEVAFALRRRIGWGLRIRSRCGGAAEPREDGAPIGAPESWTSRWIWLASTSAGALAGIAWTFEMKRRCGVVRPVVSVRVPQA